VNAYDVQGGLTAPYASQWECPRDTKSLSNKLPPGQGMLSTRLLGDWPKLTPYQRAYLCWGQPTPP
jgi:hypothetical protein